MAVIRKNLDFEIKQVGDPEERMLEFVGSTADVDRYGDVIEVAGWDLKNYQKNPVFLWAHNYNMPPVGKAVKVEKGDQGLLFQVQFPTAEEYAFADTIFKLYLGGYLRATSVGFRDMEREPLTDKEGKQTGWHYKKQELYELSAVPVPANPQALVLAVQKGVVSQEEAEQVKGLVTKEAGEAGREAPEAKDEDAPATETEAPSLSEYGRRRLERGLTPSGKDHLDALLDLEQRVAEFLAQAKEGRELMTLAQELLKSTLGLMKGDKTLLTDYYSLALQPDFEPPGGQPAGEALQEISKKIGELAQIAGLAGK